MRLGPTDEPLDMVTASVAACEPTSRPALTGCVEWVLACSQQEIVTGRGMPRAMVLELAALLERWHGSHSPRIAQAAAAAVAELVAVGGGRLRLCGTRDHLLAEVIARDAQPAARSGQPRANVSCGAPLNYGSYRTFAETRSEHVRWVSLPLPARQYEAAMMPSSAADDVWN